jgi:biopolymer transport protein ExbB
MSILLQITDSLGGGAAKAGATEVHISLLDLVQKGGWAMYPLGVLSIIAFYFIIERFLVIMRASKIDKNFMSNIRDYLVNGRMDAATMLCKNTNTPIARLVEKGIKRIGKPLKEVESAVESEGKLELYKLEKNMNFLAIISGIAPMFGFLGTISGVINIFFKISQTGTFDLSVVSGGLYEKMISSGAGLLLGIIAHVGFNLLNGMIDRVSYQVERAAVEFIDLLNEPA